ncbi:MAG: glycosyltransferase [Pseudomonadota bacterium]
MTGWEFFDRIYCITLHERPDRRRSAEAAFRELGLLDRVLFYVARRHPVDPEQGIFESHQACIRSGLDAGAARIAVFEDDVVIERYSPHRLSQCLDYLKSCPQWDLLLFGALVTGSRRTENPATLSVRYRSLSHAYVVNRPLARQIAEMPWRHAPYDAMLQRLASHCYAVYPAFAFQSDAPTDNRRLKWLDRCRRAFGGLKRIQKINEWYHRNRWAVLFGHAVVGALALAWLLR